MSHTRAIDANMLLFVMCLVCFVRLYNYFNSLLITEVMERRCKESSALSE